MATAFLKVETEIVCPVLETGTNQLNEIYPIIKDKDLLELSELMKKYNMAFRNISRK